MCDDAEEARKRVVGPSNPSGAQHMHTRLSPPTNPSVVSLENFLSYSSCLIERVNFIFPFTFFLILFS